MLERTDKKDYNFDLEFVHESIKKIIVITEQHKHEEEQPEEFRREYAEEDYTPNEIEILKRNDGMIEEGLLYTSRYELPALRDGECRHGSRVLCAKVLMERGADPNIQSPEVLHTPLHWLAYWGDHRATKAVLDINSKQHILSSSCCGKDKLQKLRDNGALNSFFTSNGQTPADIAGDLNNFQTLFNTLEYFITQKEDIRLAFITPSLIEKHSVGRFSRNYTEQVNFFELLKKQAFDIELVYLKSNNFTKEMRSYIHIVYWAINLRRLKGHEHKEEAMQRFLYFFILDLGISPFVECYRGKSIMQACVSTRRVALLEQLLLQRYIVKTPGDLKILEETTKDEDDIGNNIYHTVFSLPTS